METMGSVLSCSARSARGWRWGTGKITRKGNRSIFAYAGVAIATKETLTPVAYIPEKAARVGKGQDELLVRCGLDEAAKKEENTAEGEPVQ
jgi:hypothetical protein